MLTTMADTRCDNDDQEIGTQAPTTPGGSLVTPQTMADDDEVNVAIATKTSSKTAATAAATATRRLKASTSAERSQILTEEEPSSASSLAPETLPLHSPYMASSSGVEQASSEVSSCCSVVMDTESYVTFYISV